MRRTARAIIIHNDRLLIMRRNKFGVAYDTLPGGEIELGETPEQAVVREIHEETSITFHNPRLVMIEHAGPMYGDQLIFLGDYVSGEPKLQTDSDEYLITAMGQNLYTPAWLPLRDLAEINFVSKELQRAILRGVKEGWPDRPIEFTSTRHV